MAAHHCVGKHMGEYYKLWLYWKTKVYKASESDPIKESIYIHPYFIEYPKDEYIELKRCFADIKDPILVTQIYNEYRVTDTNPCSDRGSKNIWYEACATTPLVQIDLDVECSEYGLEERINYKAQGYTPKMIKATLKWHRREFQQKIHRFVYHYVFTRKVDVMIMKEWKAKLWRNGALTAELQAAVSKREIHP